MMDGHTYLGNGIFIAVTGLGFCLSTSNGVETTNEILLDERVYKAVRDYCDRVLAKGAVMDHALLDATLETALLQSPVADRVRRVKACTNRRCVCPQCDSDRREIGAWMVQHWDALWETVT